jgi:hypothetical protein
MTIGELIELAAEARRELSGDAQVRIAYQPGWPIRAALRYVTIPPSASPDDLYDQDETAVGQDNDGTFLRLAIGPAPTIGYGSLFSAGFR